VIVEDRVELLRAAVDRLVVAVRDGGDARQAAREFDVCVEGWVGVDAERERLAGLVEAAADAPVRFSVDEAEEILGGLRLAASRRKGLAAVVAVVEERLGAVS
jgi:hypothetical protein